jgi:hypothetical protein
LGTLIEDDITQQGCVSSLDGGLCHVPAQQTQGVYVCTRIGCCTVQEEPHTLQQRSAFFGFYQWCVDHMSQGGMYTRLEQELGGV